MAVTEIRPDNRRAAEEPKRRRNPANMGQILRWMLLFLGRRGDGHAHRVHDLDFAEMAARGL